MMGRLFLWGSAGYLLGNLLVNVQGQQFFSWCLVLLAGGIAVATLTSWRLIAPWGLALVSMIAGFMLVQHELQSWDKLPQFVAFTGRGMIVHREAPQLWSQPLIIKPIEKNLVETNILWQAPRTTDLTPGAIIQFDCHIHRPENFEEKFDYRRYLASKSIGYICEHEQVVAALRESSFWRTKLFAWQISLRNRIASFLTDPAAGLLQGLFLGGNDGLSAGLREAFKRAGLSHIVAVSGYNMSLVAMAALFVALFAGFWRKTATVLAMTGILIFLLLIDTSAASLRAALMAWTGFIAFFLGRPLQLFNGLLLAALLMALVQPLIVRYDVGFQLSFLATLMLFLASPWLAQLVRRGQWYWSGVALLLSTIVIELGIFPVIAFHFGMVSLLTPLANLIVLPLIPLAMAFGFGMLLFGSMVPLLGTLFALPTWLLLMGVVWISEWIGSLPFGVLEQVTLPVSFMVGWYIVLGGIVWYSRKLYQRYVFRLDH